MILRTQNAKMVPKLHPNWLFLIIGLLFLCSGRIGFSQPVANRPPKIITLEDAWELATRYNKDLQIAKEEVIYADGQVREAWAGALPVISASGQYQRNIESPVFYITMTDPNTGQEATQTFKIGDDNSYAGVLRIQQPLWLAGKIGLGLKAAKLYRELSHESLRSEGISLRYQIANDFYGVLLTRALLDVTKDSYDLAVKHANRIHELFDQGQVSEYDVIRADVQAANLQPTVLEAENILKLAENALKSRLGIDLKAEVKFQGELIPAEQTHSAMEKAYIAALQHRPEQQMLDLQKQLNEVQYTAESREIYWPNLFLSADATWQTQAGDYQFDEYEWNRSVSAYLQVSVPLFDGFRTKARKQKVKARGRQLLYQEIQFHDGLRLELQATLDNIHTAEERLAAAQKTVQQAERGLGIAEVRYENGISTLLEVLDAELALRAAKTQYLKSVYDQRIAISALERALGQLGLNPEETEEHQP